MSDEMMPHGHSGHEVEYEHEDLGTRGAPQAAGARQFDATIELGEPNGR